VVSCVSKQASCLKILLPALIFSLVPISKNCNTQQLLENYYIAINLFLQMKDKIKTVISVIIILLIGIVFITESKITYSQVDSKTNVYERANKEIVINVPTLWKNCDMDIHENITIESKLEIINSTITFCGEHISMVAVPNSTLLVENSSINATGSYSIFIEEDVNFSFTNSSFSNFGWKDLELLRNYTSGDKYIEYNRYLWLQAEFTRNLNIYGNDGIVIKSKAKSFRNNVFTNYTSIRFYSSNNTIEKNIFLKMKNEGLAFMTGADGNTIRNNYFGYSARMNREINALRFYTATKNEKIYSNTFEWIPISILIANIPPWNAGENFEIHDNTMGKVIFGLNGKLKDSHIWNETYNSTVQPMSIQASSNVVIENCTLSNITFQRARECYKP